MSPLSPLGHQRGSGDEQHLLPGDLVRVLGRPSRRSGDENEVTVRQKKTEGTIE